MVRKKTFNLQYTYDSLISNSNPFVTYNNTGGLFTLSLERSDSTDNKLPRSRSLTIKKAWTRNNYYDSIDRNCDIQFNDFATDEKFCVFIIEPKDERGKQIEEEKKYVHLRKGDIEWVVIHGYNYQIKLEDVFTTKEKILGTLGKNRTVALLNIKIWKEKV